MFFDMLVFLMIVFFLDMIVYNNNEYVIYIVSCLLFREVFLLLYIMIKFYDNSK